MTIPTDCAARVAELESILFTVDGKGKEAKRTAFYDLYELMRKLDEKARGRVLEIERDLSPQ